ncbi:ferritin-like domain-containing protein [Hymenobacter sp. M29]|uniref:Ferritin-like domain-containing protein n=1 Tax=Hymenobacter mellowenesis TaxID=3063995 RepID=A0ABT9A7G3_9BACT|nr:ferritin-like domain-containing protein [Hymenobacter sp. M29]MDO7845327.1 ferritin-like domain-containing protein [Hymenobacter sp. M29]
MNFFQIIDQLAAVDPDVLDRFDSRRAVFSSLGSVAKRSALAATPLFLGALFQKAYAGTTSTPVDVLNYALTLELLEADFYRLFLAAGTLPNATATAAITQIKKHEDAHVALLTRTIQAAGGTPVTGTATTGIRFKPSAFPSTYAGQLRVAQLLEDTGVRAYKGRAAELVGTTLLTTALQIHSVEARHAAHIRLMRGQLPWVNSADDLATDPTYTSGVTGTTSTQVTTAGGAFGIPAYSTASPAESSTVIGTVPLTTGITTAPAVYSAADAAAAFDQVLQPAEVVDASRAGGLLA